MRGEYMERSSLIEERLKVLRKLIPEAFDGEEILPVELLNSLGLDSQNTELMRRERFGLTWDGRRDAAKAARTGSKFTLAQDFEQSLDVGKSNSIFIHGENLDVLKNLKSYHGKIKLIYLDPPYNTLNDYIYEDDFSTPLEKYLTITGQISSEGDKLSTNIETSGRFHSKWLTMIYPRLLLCRTLLQKEGVICISIDDTEVSNLRMVMNEIFGEENFVSSMIWQGTEKNDSKLVSNNHDYVLVYAKNKSTLRELVKETPWRVRKEGLDDIMAIAEKIISKTPNSKIDYRAASQELNEWYSKLPNNHPSKDHRHYKNIDEKGVYFAGAIDWPGGGGPKYEIIHPETGKPVKIPGPGWRFTKETMLKMIEENNIHFGPDETTLPGPKRYLSETSRQVLGSVFYCDRRGAAIRLKKLMGNNVFDYPKDELVLMNIIEAFTNPGDIILDVFGGSGTTGHAVLQLNAESGTTRNFIVATLPEKVNLKTKSGKIAAELGFENVSDITYERLKLASESLKKEFEPKENVDLGFETFRLVPNSIQSWDDELSEQTTLATFLEEISSESKSDYPYETMTELLIQASRPLTGPRAVIDNEAFSGHLFGSSTLIIGLLKNTDAAITELANLSKNVEVVCAFDRIFSGNDSVKMNFKHILKDRGIIFFTR